MKYEEINYLQNCHSRAEVSAEETEDFENKTNASSFPAVRMTVQKLFSSPYFIMYHKITEIQSGLTQIMKQAAKVG